MLFFGDILKTFGINGELIIKLSNDAPDKINTKEPVFIIIDGLSVPFYFNRVENRGTNKVLAVFDDMETAASAQELVGKKIYYQSDEELEEIQDLGIFIGFTLIDKQLGELGKVSDFFDFPNNPCFQIIYNEKEVLIPVNEDLIEGIDEQEQIILLNLPEGLLNIYME